MLAKFPVKYRDFVVISILHLPKAEEDCLQFSDHIILYLVSHIPLSSFAPYTLSTSFHSVLRDVVKSSIIFILIEVR